MLRLNGNVMTRDQIPTMSVVHRPELVAAIPIAARSEIGETSSVTTKKVASPMGTIHTRKPTNKRFPMAFLHSARKRPSIPNAALELCRFCNLHKELF